MAKMRSQPQLIWSLLLALGLLLTHRTANAEAEAGDGDRVKALEYFRLGNEAFAEGDLLQAYTEYRTAWLLHRTFDIACNLGRTEAELNKARDAAEHLHYCLNNFSASTRPEVREAESKLRELFQRVRAQVTMLRLVVEPAGAFVTLDGNTVGKAPIHEAIFVDPGTRTISVKRAGYTSVSQQVTAQGGQSREVRVSLIAFSEAPATSTPPTPEPAAPGAEPAASHGIQLRTVALIGGGVLTLGALGVGIGYQLHASKLDDDAGKLRAETSREDPRRYPCGRDNPPERCPELNSTVRRMDSAQNVAIAGFVSAGVAAAATTALYFLWQPEPANAGVSPMLAPGVAGISLWAKL
jgi:hypothetical protein